METIAIEDIVALGDKSYLPFLLERGRKQVQVRCWDGVKISRYSILAFAYAYFKFNGKYGVPVSVKQIPDIDDIPTPKLHDKLLRAGLRATYESLNGKTPYNEIAEVAYDIVEFQNNQCIEHLTEYSLSLDATDLLEIEEDPEIQAIRKQMFEGIARERTSSGKFRYIKMAYDKFAKLLQVNRFGKWRMNGYSQLSACGSAKVTQMQQGIISKGFSSDVNSDFFSSPVEPAFADGLDSPYEFMLECASGAKAAMYQSDPMKLTEYLHRLVQMLVATFQNLHLGECGGPRHGDCGSTVTYPMTIKEKHLPYIVGKYYLDDTDTPVEIRSGDNGHLVGQTLRMRNPAGCKVVDENGVPDEHGCCLVCMGAVGHAIAKNANVGHVAATRLMGTGSQKVLSVKHEDLGSLSLTMQIKDVFQPFLKLGANGREVNLNRKNIRIGIPTKCIPNIQYLYYVDDVTKLTVPDFSKINEISIIDTSDGNTGEIPSGSIGTQGEVVHLCLEFLEYIKENRDKVHIEDYKRAKYYFIEIDDYPEDKPIFLAPFKHFDMLIQHKQTKRLFWSSNNSNAKDESVANTGPRLVDFNTFGEAAIAALEITQEKLGINLAVIEAAIYPFTVRDPERYDYRPARHTNVCQFMALQQLYDNRSLAAKLVSEQQGRVLASPKAILAKRSAHPYDDGLINKDAA